MQKNTTSQSGFFNPRVLLAFTLSSAGALLAVLSLAVTPPAETTRAYTSVPPDPAKFPTTFGSHANRLPRWLPLPPGGYPVANVAAGNRALIKLSSGVWNTALIQALQRNNKDGNTAVPS